mmetsp:Transcript_7096/g.23336  ORF Transcript_7096/g.23336 Transcript_7096/m.23336 type:complete len:124 (+) Transcript_7096:614-985(+)
MTLRRTSLPYCSATTGHGDLRRRLRTASPRRDEINASYEVAGILTPSKCVLFGGAATRRKPPVGPAPARPDTQRMLAYCTTKKTTQTTSTTSTPLKRGAAKARSQEQVLLLLGYVHRAATLAN